VNWKRWQKNGNRHTSQSWLRARCRLFTVLQNFALYGVDFSDGMIRLAQKYAGKFNFQVNLAVADVCYLPYNNETFDYVISIATYHHLKRQQQLTAFQELKRVLKPGGTAFVTVWNQWQPRFWFKGKEVQVPWQIQNETLYRYYYYLHIGTKTTGNKSRFRNGKIISGKRLSLSC